MKKMLSLLPLLTLAISCNQFTPGSSSEFAATASPGPGNPDVQIEMPSPPPQEVEVPNESVIIVTNPAPAPAPEIPSVPETTPVPEVPVVIGVPPAAPLPEKGCGTVVVKPIPDKVVPAPSHHTKIPEVCVEMSNELSGSVQDGYGIIGKIYDASNTVASSFSQVKAKGLLLEDDIYLPGLNISRTKNLGFKRTNGTYILNSQGTNLINKFGLDLQTNLALDADDEEGYYQISVIADDGVKIEAGNNVLISADHNSPTKFSCLHKKMMIKMEKGKHIPLKVKFYQGSQMQLALILMWRRVQDKDGKMVNGAVDQDLHEKRCGQAGNQFFFDPTSNIHPTMDYQDLLNPAKRTIPWKVVKHRNYQLPPMTSNKVCK